MLGGFMLSVGSLLFTIVLLIVYFLKRQRYSSSKKTFFLILLFVTIIVLLVEASDFIGLYKKDYIGEIYVYMLRIEIVLKMIWVTLINYYLLSFGTDYDTSSVKDVMKNDKRLSLLTVFLIISIVIYIILPTSLNVINHSTYQEGLSFVWFIVYSFIMVLISLFIVVKKKNTITSKDITVILTIMSVLSMSEFLQLVFPHVFIVTTGFTITLYILYFAFENPDLFLIRELETTKKEIERANSAKTDFLSNTTHEIRGPMNAIMGFTVDLLNTENIDVETAKKDITNINEAANNLLSIVNNILDISKIETGTEKLNNVDYSVPALVEELRKMIEPRLSDKVSFITNIGKDIPENLNGDKTKIFQVLLNVLSNSAKYTEVGKIKLNIDGSQNGDVCNLSISISDTGIGIKEEDYDKVFEKFAKIEEQQQDVEGTGLGLVIAKQLINLMGGNIHFKSHYLAGTTFYIKLDQKISSNQVVTDKITTTKKENTDYLDCSKYSILIVDDNKLNIKVAEKLLEPYNFTIKSVNNGEDCIKEVKKDNFYDMIFLDHMMPQMDGIEVLHILKSLDGYKLPPIVAVTANAITGMREMYLKEGFDEYLPKPINTKDLDILINKYFNKEEK